MAAMMRRLSTTMKMKNETSAGCRSRGRERRLLRTDSDAMGSSCSRRPGRLMLQWTNRACLTCSR
jgi:hypothetical protein